MARLTVEPKASSMAELPPVDFLLGAVSRSSKGLRVGGVVETFEEVTGVFFAFFNVFFDGL